MTCSKMYGMVRDPGVSLSLEQVALTHIWKKYLEKNEKIFGKKWKCPQLFQCDLEEGGGFMFHTCYNEEDLEPYNCKRSQFEISVSGKRQILLFSEKDLSSCLRILEILRLVINSATWSPARWLESQLETYFGSSLKIIGEQCLTDGILQKHIEDLGVRLQRQVSIWIDQRLGNLKNCYNLQPLRLEEEIWWKISSKGTRTVRTVKFWNLWHKQKAAFELSLPLIWFIWLLSGTATATAIVAQSRM